MKHKIGENNLLEFAMICLSKEESVSREEEEKNPQVLSKVLKVERTCEKEEEKTRREDGQSAAKPTRPSVAIISLCLRHW